MRKSTGTEIFLLALIGLCAISSVAARFFSSVNNTALSVYNDGYKTSYENSELYVKTVTVGIRLSDEDAFILLNGEKYACETSNKNEYRVTCCEKDVLEMDLRFCDNEEVTAYVFEADNALASPLVGTKCVGSSGIVMLFKVYFR